MRARHPLTIRNKVSVFDCPTLIITASQRWRSADVTRSIRIQGLFGNRAVRFG
jgi:hypothetical protein